MSTARAVPQSASPLLVQYLDFLRDQQGVSQATIAIRRLTVRRFLQFYRSSRNALTAASAWRQTHPRLHHPPFVRLDPRTPEASDFIAAQLCPPRMVTWRSNLAMKRRALAACRAQGKPTDLKPLPNRHRDVIQWFDSI